MRPADHTPIVNSSGYWDYYLRKTPTSLEAAEGSYQGPFTQSQRDWLAERLTGAEPTAAPIGAAEVFKH